MLRLAQRYWHLDGPAIHIHRLDTVGMFLDHVEHHPTGVTIPALLPRQATAQGLQQLAKDAREVQFV